MKQTTSYKKEEAQQCSIRIRKMITNQQIFARILRLEITLIHFQGLLLDNYREMDEHQVALASTVMDHINQEISWLRQNL